MLQHRHVISTLVRSLCFKSSCPDAEKINIHNSLTPDVCRDPIHLFLLFEILTKIRKIGIFFSIAYGVYIRLSRPILYQTCLLPNQNFEKNAQYPADPAEPWIQDPSVFWSFWWGSKQLIKEIPWNITHNNMDKQVQYSKAPQIIMSCQNWRLEIKRPRAWNSYVYLTYLGCDPCTDSFGNTDAWQSVWAGRSFCLFCWTFHINVLAGNSKCLLKFMCLPHAVFKKIITQKSKLRKTTVATRIGGTWQFRRQGKTSSSI